MLNRGFSFAISRFTALQALVWGIGGLCLGACSDAERPTNTGSEELIRGKFLPRETDRLFEQPFSGPAWQLSSSAIDFGNVGVDERSVRRMLTLTNTGSTPIQNIWHGTPNSSFEVVSDCYWISLAPTQSCHFYVTFRPRTL